MSVPNSTHPHLRYAILGSGALGGYYGIMLAHYGCEVHFVARSDYGHIRQHGLHLQTRDKHIHLPHVNVVAHVSELPPVDVLLIATKTTENAGLLKLIQETPGKPAIVILQNGLGIEQELETKVGVGRILGGCCFLCSNKVGPGRIHHLDFGRITLGWSTPESRQHAVNPNLAEQMAHDFQNSGIDMQVIPDMLEARWRKLMWNIPYNGLSVALNASTAEIMSNPASASLVFTIMEEVRGAAQACGKKIEAEFTTKLMEQTTAMVPYDSSMRLDYRAQRPMELEAIYARPIAAAEAAGYSMPSVKMLYHQLRFMQSRYDRAGERISPNP